MASLSTSTDSLQDLSAVDEELRRDVDSLRLLLGGVADEQSYSGAQESVGGKSRAIFWGPFSKPTSGLLEFCLSVVTYPLLRLQVTRLLAAMATERHCL